LSAVVGFGVVLDWLTVRAFPWLVVAMLLPLVAAAFCVPRQREPAHEQGAASGALAVLREAPVRWFFASVFFTVLAHTALYMFFSLYLDSLGYGKKVVGLMWATGVVAEIALLAWPGRWFDRCSPRTWLLIAAAVAAVRFAVIAAAGQWWWVLVIASLAHALTFAAHHVACISLVHRHFPGRLRARGQALYSVLGYGGSGVVGGVAGGALIEAAGYASVFWAASAAALAGAVCAWRMGAGVLRESTQQAGSPAG
jgi:MFS transporter, PPP family, 3-phenylpropionic acid transporter